MAKQYSNKTTLPALVLNDSTPEDVGRAMIENGLQKQPFFIFDMDEAFRRVQHFRDIMPRVKLFYAIKTNNTEMFLKFAISQRTGFSCASPGEIEALRKLGVNPRSILFAMPTKTPEQMTYARESGVRHTTFDSSYELKKLSENWPDAQLLIRIRIKSDCKIELRDKFGCDFKKEAFNLLEEAAKLGLKVVGVAFRVVTNSLEDYIVGMKYAKALFDHEARAGRAMTILDIGGGFRSDQLYNFDEVSNLINASLEELFPDPSIQVIAEPGRYLCGSAFTLYCNICSIRTVKRDGTIINMVYLNDGIYGSFRYSEKWYTVKKFMRATEQDTGELQETVLWGPSGDSLDIVMKHVPVYLPKCTPLDWLVFEHVGANTISFSTKFSSLDTPLIRPVVSIELWNTIKDRSSFSPTDFIMIPNISSPLPVCLPPTLPEKDIFEHTNIPKLKV